MKGPGGQGQFREGLDSIRNLGWMGEMGRSVQPLHRQNNLVLVWGEASLPSGECTTDGFQCLVSFCVEALVWVAAMFYLCFSVLPNFCSNTCLSHLAQTSLF